MQTPFVPNILRFKKHRRRFPGGKEVKRVNQVSYIYGIQTLDSAPLYSYHIEMMRRTITNFFRRQVKLLIRCYPNRSCTAKPHDVRRGRGKGAVDRWYTFVREGRIIIEFTSPTEEKAIQLHRIVRSKLPIKTKLAINKNLENIV